MDMVIRNIEVEETAKIKNNSRFEMFLPMNFNSDRKRSAVQLNVDKVGINQTYKGLLLCNVRLFVS